MRVRRLTSIACVLFAPMLARCDPADAAAPPTTAQNATPPASDDTAAASDESTAGSGAGASGATGRAAAQVTGGPSFASREYVLGDDSDAPAADPQDAPAQASTQRFAQAGAPQQGRETTTDGDGYDDSDPSALTDFRTTLDPYGTWVDDSTYGTVWVPSPAVVGTSFVPYSTAGHWVYDDEWAWASDYSWGWAPFHYGRWVLIGGRGWAWIPGRVYRGAWVTWGVDDGYGYVGWYPMSPAFLWFGGVAVGYSFWIGPSWVYCPRGYVFSPVVGQHIIAGSAAAPIAVRVRPIAVARPGVVAGPSPQRLGYSAAQIPHTAGRVASGIARARQFARPSTARPLGARAPLYAQPLRAPSGRTPYVEPRLRGVPIGPPPARGGAPAAGAPVGHRPVEEPSPPALRHGGGWRGGGWRGGSVPSGGFRGGGSGGFRGGGGVHHR